MGFNLDELIQHDLARPVQLAPSAAQKVTDLLTGQDGVLKIGVRGGGCTGFQYHLALDVPADDDLVYEDAGVTIAIDRGSVPYLVGSVLEFKDSLQESGFAFQNPNAHSSCGCGSSFRMDPYEGCGPTEAESAV